METVWNGKGFVAPPSVSVPLRGLDMWKLVLMPRQDKLIVCVSVPLRGLDMWKLWRSRGTLPVYCVSVPLRGLDMWKR